MKIVVDITTAGAARSRLGCYRMVDRSDRRRAEMRDERLDEVGAHLHLADAGLGL